MVKLNRIYTRTGDAGDSGLVDGSRRPKHNALFAAIGDVDEANSAIGLARVAAAEELARELVDIQSDLFDLGADLATPADPERPEPFAAGEMDLRIVSRQVERLERGIDAMTARLSPLTSFVLPGGSELAARLHSARASVRRAERSAVAVAALEPVNPAALAYLNRLSDWLFTAARIANDDGRGDVLWVPGAGRAK